MLKGVLISTTLHRKSVGLSPSLNNIERRPEEGEGQPEERHGSEHAWNRAVPGTGL